jgi:hypothetical protein
VRVDPCADRPLALGGARGALRRDTTLQVGGALGLAVLATIATTKTKSLHEAGDSTAAALNGGYHLAYLIGAVLVLVAIAVAATVLQPKAERTL